MDMEIVGSEQINASFLMPDPRDIGAVVYR